MNLGAYVNGRRPKSKKAVREALAADPASVSFDNTSIYGPHAGMTFGAAELPEGTYQLVGPDPYTARNFYGTVTVRGGKVTVK